MATVRIVLVSVATISLIVVGRLEATAGVFGSAQTAVDHQGGIRTGGKRFRTPSRKPTDGQAGRPKIPFPGSVSPEQVIANIKAMVEQTSLRDQSGIPELANAEHLRARRILKVKSDLYESGYIVVELEDERGAAIANFAYQPDGSPIMVEDARKQESRRSLSLTDAASKVRGHGRVALSVDHVYFHNVAEPGLSLCRPLTRIATREGFIYLNSRGEAFVEAGTAIARQMASAAGASDQPSVGVKTLLPIRAWE